MSPRPQQPSPDAPLAIRLGPDTTMTLRFVPEPTTPRRRRRSPVQPARLPAASGTRASPTGSGYSSV